MAHKHSQHDGGCMHTSAAPAPTPGAGASTVGGGGSSSLASGTTRQLVAVTHHSDTGSPMHDGDVKQRGTVRSTTAVVRVDARPSDGKHEEHDKPASTGAPDHNEANDPTSEATCLAGLVESTGSHGDLEGAVSQGDFVSAEGIVREELAALRGVHGDGDHKDLVCALYDLGRVIHLRDDAMRAQPVLREALAMARHVYDGSDRVVVANIARDLARVVRTNDGPTDEVIDLHRERVAILRRVHDGKEHSDVITGLMDLAQMLQSCGDLTAAVAPLREAVAMARSVHKDAVDGHSDIVEALNHLGELLYEREDPTYGEPQLREALDMARRVHGGHDHNQVAEVMSILALSLHDLGDSSAEDLLREAVAMQGRLRGDGYNCSRATVLGRLGFLLWRKGELAEAERHLLNSFLFEQILHEGKPIHGGKTRAHAAPHMLTLAEVFRASGQLAAAAVVLQDVLSLLLRHDGEHHDPTGQRVRANHLLGDVLWHQAKLPGAERALRQALNLELRLCGGNTHVSKRQFCIVGSLRSVLLDQDRFVGTERLLRELLVRLRREHGSKDHWFVAITLDRLAAVLYVRRDLARAGPLLLEALAMMRRLPDETPHEDSRSAHLVTVLETLAQVLKASGDHAGAASLMREALASQRRVHGGLDHYDVVKRLLGVGECLRGRRDWAGALAVVREAVAMVRRLHKGQDHWQVASASSHLAISLHDSGDAGASLKVQRESLAMLRRLYGSHDHRGVAASLLNVGVALVGAGDAAGAERLLRESADMWCRLRGTPGRDREQDDPGILAALRELARVLYANGKHDELGVVMGKLMAVTKASRAKLQQ